MSRAHLSSATVVVRNGSFSEAKVDEEIVAFSAEKGACYGFNSVGSRIWQLLANPISVSDICKTLMSEYEVDPETCEHEVLKLLEKLRAEGMITSPPRALRTGLAS
jgi:coenzyme PQQ synthesis protein D (PqqD)